MQKEAQQRMAEVEAREAALAEKEKMLAAKEAAVEKALADAKTPPTSPSSGQEEAI